MKHNPGSPTASPEKKALLEAFDTVLKTTADERDAERATAERRRRRRGMSRLLMGGCATVLLLVGLYLSVARPDWIFPPALPPESLAAREASLRIAVATAAQHVEHFRQQNRQLPATLAQAGVQRTGITYDRTADGYRLQGQAPDVRVTYNSSEPLSRFVGNSFKVISRSGQ